MDLNHAAMEVDFALGSGAGNGANANPDWRSQFPPDGRLRVVNILMQTFERYIPELEPELLAELEKIISRLEQTLYDTATSQTDYHRKVSLRCFILKIYHASQGLITPPVQVKKPRKKCKICGDYEHKRRDQVE